MKTRTIIPVLVGGTMLLGGGPQKAKGPEGGRWLMPHIRIADWNLTLRMPEQFSPDYPVFPIRESLQFTDPQFLQSRRIDLINIAWDYRGHFWQGSFGTLSLKVNIKYSGNNTFDLMNKADLLSYWRAASEEARRKMQERAQALHIDSGLLSHDYRVYEWKLMGGSEWLNYKEYYEDGTVKYDNWIHALDSNHTILIYFEYTPNMDKDGSKSDWKLHASQLEEDILKSVSLIH